MGGTTRPTYKLGPFSALSVQAQTNITKASHRYACTRSTRKNYKYPPNLPSNLQQLDAKERLILHLMYEDYIKAMRVADKADQRAEALTRIKGYLKFVSRVFCLREHSLLTLFRFGYHSGISGPRPNLGRRVRLKGAPI